MQMKKNFNNVLIVHNEDFYKEINIDEFDTELLYLGNSKKSNISLQLDLNKRFNVEFKKINESWQISDGENTYCVVNGIKVPRRIISNGDKITIKDIEIKNELFKIDYFLDYIVEYEDFDRVLSIENLKKIKFGRGSNNNIIIDDDELDKNYAEINKDSDGDYLIDLKSRYGLYLNGVKVEGKIKIKDNDFIILCGYKFLYKTTKMYMSKNNKKISLNKLEEIIIKEESPSSYPCFYRSPRLLKGISQEDIIIDEPPNKEKKDGGGNLLITILPLVGTVVITIAVSSANNSGGGSIISTVATTGLAVFVALLAYFMESYHRKKNQYKRYKRYKEYVKKKELQIVEKRKLLMESIRNNNPDTEECISFLENFNRRLWERTPAHDDFLNISLGRGMGDLTFDITVQDETVEIDKDKLKDDPRKLKEIYGKMEDVPICINLTEELPVGIYGDRDNVIELVKNLVIKISTLHFYEEVKIAAIYPKEEQEKWEWLKWIPHTWSNKKEFRYIGNTKESAHNVLNQLYDEIKNRKDEDNKHEKKIYSPYYVVFIADKDLIENEPVMGILESTEQYGATGIFVYDDLGLIPKESKKVIEVIDNHNAKYIDVLDANYVKDITFNPISDEVCEGFARKMSPIYVKNSFTQGQLTSYFTLFDLYGINKENELPIITNWNSNKVYESMAVPLGVRAGNEVVYLNLHEKFHGPHGLVAGTTGSGKSEILQTYIASLAINYHPYDVSIIIIDYKGGGMANQFASLPHLVGTITNLDGNQINRALVSIKSELKRRQRIFAEYNVNHIDSYIKLFKEGKAVEPLPHLIMIADEFAELKNDQPEFMTELVSTARIGRSLGVHLILATQKPSGVVDDQIWSNSKFKLCLKVQDTDDSNEMIKTPLAANIVEAGRAYFQVGNNEVFELFQSAWSGAKKYENNDISKKEIEIDEVLIDGSRRELYSSKEDSSKKVLGTQLDAVINYIEEVAEENNIKRLNGPWMPPLKETIYLDEIIGTCNKEKWFEDKKDINPVIGIFDNPKMQIQDNLSINLSKDGHMLIIGSPGVGKTTFIQTIVTSMMKTYTPEEINIYMLDFGTRILKMYEKSPHVGGVVTADEEELLKNFIKFIDKEIIKRKRLLSEAGVSNLGAYNDLKQDKLPHIAVIIDNFAAFLELYEDYEEYITRFTRDGANLGISFIITGSNTSDIRYKISSNIKTSIALNCVDDSEYGSIFGRIEIKPCVNEGRGLVKLDEVCEFQTALPIEGKNEGERATRIKELIQDINTEWNGRNAAEIPMIPDILSIEKYTKNKPVTEGINNIYIGIDVNEFEYISIDLDEVNFYPIIGETASGKSNLMKVISRAVKESCNNTEIYVYDSESFALSSLNEGDSLSFYGNDTNEIIENLIILKEEIMERRDYIRDTLIESRGSIKESDLLDKFTKKVLFIDNAEEFFNNIQDDYEALELFETIAEKKNGYGFSVILADEEEKITDLSYTHSFIGKFKKENKGVIIMDLEEQNFFNVRLNYSNKEKSLKIGEGFVITKEGYSRIRMPIL